MRLLPLHPLVHKACAKSPVCLNLHLIERPDREALTSLPASQSHISPISILHLDMSWLNLYIWRCLQNLGNGKANNSRTLVKTTKTFNLENDEMSGVLLMNPISAAGAAAAATAAGAAEFAQSQLATILLVYMILATATGLKAQK